MNKRSFIDEILKLNFSHFAYEGSSTKSYVRFYFILSDNMISFPDMKRNQQYYLNVNGVFKPFKQKNFFDFRDGFPLDKSLFVYSRQSMDKIRTAIKEAMDQAEDYCNTKKIQIYPKYFLNVELEKVDNPPHIFTFKELENVLKKGDDKKKNTLVIDENGKFSLVSKDALSYPVRFEMFCAGNGYVGKSVSQEKIEAYYGMALSGWLYYLKECKPIFVDYRMDSLSNEEKVKRIKRILEGTC